jgi:UDP-glucose 4-epimerase
MREGRGVKIVITGALGHIGSRLIHDILPGEFREVVLLDNLLTQRYGSLFNLPGGVPFRFHAADILTADLAGLFQGAHAVVHLAAVTDAAASFERPEEAERVNLEGTERVARACLEAGARLIALSTTSVYTPASASVDEGCSGADLQPRTPYAVSKLRAEGMLAALGASRGLRFTVCRFGTIYGVSPGMRFHTAVNRFAWQAAMGEPLTVWRTALNQLRPYLDVSDAARALKFVLRADLFDNSVHNVLTENATVAELLAILRAHAPDLAISEVDSPAMNALSYRVSCERFKAKGFAFHGSLAKGVGETFALLRNARSAGAGTRP